jgi:hypothetical protein
MKLMSKEMVPMLSKENGLDYLTCSILLLFWLTAILSALRPLSH